MSKAILGRHLRRMISHSFQCVQKQSECPFAVCPSLDEYEPLIGEGCCQSPLDVFPSSNTTIVHEHQGTKAEGVAVLVAEVSFCCCPDMGKDEVAGSFTGEALEVYAVPCWNCRCEDAWIGAQKRRSVVAYSEAIAVVWSPAIKTKP